MLIPDHVNHIALPVEFDQIHIGPHKQQPPALDTPGPAPDQPTPPTGDQVSLRSCAALSEEETDPFDTALVALALSEVINAPAPPSAAEVRLRARISRWQTAGAVVLWAVRTILILCGVTTLLPWVSAEAGGPAGPRLDLFSLNPAAAAVILLCLGGCLGLSFAAPRYPILRTILVLQVLVTCVAVLVPFALYSGPGARAAYDAWVGTPADSARGPEGMGWGAWVCLATCGLALAGTMAYLFMPARSRLAEVLTEESAGAKQ